jgi:adenylate kinase
MPDCHAVLLLGPTGSGKTPLGDALEHAGIHGHRAAHFDFGSHLRAAVAQPQEYPLLTGNDIALLNRKLRTNALLDNNEFPIAERIVGSFVENRRLGAEDYLILNGLPRHLGQAEAVGKLVTVEKIIYLDCPAQVVLQRILTNAGGDRTVRTDDTFREIENKLNIFRDRTLPLLEFYRSRAVPVRSIRIGNGMRTSEVLAATELVPGR